MSFRKLMYTPPNNNSFSMLTIHGKFIQVGLPDDGAMPAINGFMFIKNGCFIGGSKIGSKKEAMAMLELAARKGLKPMWVLMI